MNANPAMSYAASGASAPHPFTLNDLRVRTYSVQEQSSNYGLVLSGIVLVGALAVSAFVLLDPLGVFVGSEPAAAPAAQAVVPSNGPARLAATTEIVLPQRAPMSEVVAPQSAISAVKAVEAVEAPAASAPAAKVSRASAPAAKNRSGRSSALEAPGRLTNKTNSATAGTNSTVLQANRETNQAPPAIAAKPQEKVDAPVTSSRGDELSNAPKPAAPGNPAPVSEEAN